MVGLKKLTTLCICLGFVQGSETTLQSTYSDTSAQPTCDYGKCGSLGTRGLMFCLLVTEQSDVFLPLDLLSPCLVFLNPNVYKMVWWAVRVAGAPLGGTFGRDVCVIKQAGVLGARNWFLWPLNILLEVCDRDLASENLEGLGWRVANQSPEDWFEQKPSH